MDKPTANSTPSPSLAAENTTSPQRNAARIAGLVPLVGTDDSEIQRERSRRKRPRALSTVESVRKRLAMELIAYQALAVPDGGAAERMRTITGAARALAAIIDLDVQKDLAAIKRMLGLGKGRVVVPSEEKKGRA